MENKKYELKITESEPQVINSKDVFFLKSPKRSPRNKSSHVFFRNPLKKESTEEISKRKEIDDLITQKIKTNSTFESIMLDPILSEALRSASK
jgi:hypothetical protein